MQVIANDSLPLSVCFDCCVLLNQCNDFVEKTNRAQESLQKLFRESKDSIEILEPNIDYVEKTVEYPKGECEEAAGDCSLSDNYVTETADDIGEEYYRNENNDSDFECKQETYVEQEPSKQKKCKAAAKKASPKQAKKRVKRRSQPRKISNSDVGATTSDMDDDQNEVRGSQDFQQSKAGGKIPDNYMTGKKNV